MGKFIYFIPKNCKNIIRDNNITFQRSFYKIIFYHESLNGCVRKIAKYLLETIILDTISTLVAYAIV